jgi:hypothetical protein
LSPLNLAVFGLLGISIAQLTRYLYDHDYKPGFILRHVDKILYAYIIVTFISQVSWQVFVAKYYASSDIEHSRILCFLTFAIPLAYFAAQTLIVFGLAQFSKRIMPIIEEHKSLV